MNRTRLDFAWVAGDGPDVVSELPEDRRVIPRRSANSQREPSVEEIRGPELQRWIDYEMPHSD